MTLFGTAISLKTLFQWAWYGALVYFSYLMLLITLQYVPVNLDVAFLRIKTDVISKTHYRLAFFTHVYTSIFVLVLGMFQFLKYIRKKYEKVHRFMGKIYIGIILFLSGPSGLVMGYYANGGTLSQISFCLLAILWIWFTYKAYRYAREKKWHQHRNFMYRSYALTLSAISLRLFKWIIVSWLALPPMDTYLIVSWLGWTFNLAVAEGMIYFFTKASLFRKKG